MFDVNDLINSGGILIICAIIFAESGLLIGFFLPGDTLLFTAGFFASQGKLPLGWLIIGMIISAIVGYEVGYEIGQRSGKSLFRKKDGIFFRQDYIVKAEKFYEKHGGKTIILGRFIPIIRTLAAVVAGVGNMPRKKFTFYNIAGALPWVLSVTLLGYWLGSKVPDIDRYILPAIVLATIFTFSSPLYHVVKARRQN